MTETVGVAIWAELIKEILKPASLLNQALFPLTAARTNNPELLAGISRTIQLPAMRLNLPGPHLSLLNLPPTTNPTEMNSSSRHHTHRNISLPSSKSFLIEDLLKESAKKNGVLGANLDTDRARGAERSSSGLMSISRSSGGLGYSTAEGCYTSSNRTAKCSDPLAESIEAEFHRRSLRKERTVFTKSQLSKLKARFCYQKYLSSEERAQLACSLSLTEEQVQRWFQNRRAKVKRQESSSTTTLRVEEGSENCEKSEPNPMVQHFTKSNKTLDMLIGNTAKRLPILPK